ncbi:hypothetical protein DsansV1_C08g0087171 [Dioscorea sansibarensis]
MPFSPHFIMYFPIYSMYICLHFFPEHPPISFLFSVMHVIFFPCLYCTLSFLQCTYVLFSFSIFPWTVSLLPAICILLLNEDTMNHSACFL